MSFLGNLKEFGKNAWDTIYDAGKTAVEVVYDVGKTGVDFVKDGANVVTSFFTPASTKTAINKMGDNIKDNVIEIGTDTFMGTANLANNLIQTGSSALQIPTDMIDDVYQPDKDNFKGVDDLLESVDNVTTYGDKIYDNKEPIVDILGKSLSTFLNGVTPSSIQSALENTNTDGNIVDTIKSFFSNLLGESAQETFNQLSDSSTSKLMNDEDLTEVKNINDLSNKDLLILSSISYTDFASIDNKGKTLGQLTNELKQSIGKTNEQDLTIDDIEKIKENGFSIGGELTNLEICDMLNEISHSNKLSNLTILDNTDQEQNYITATTYGILENGKVNGATIVFRGTDSATAWADDFDGLSETDTKMQEAANNYIYSQINGIYDISNITVTGHSKGGNLAMYTAIKNEEVITSCVSFNGQGFNDNFIKENKEDIEKVSSRITSINGYVDPINAALNSVAGTIVTVDTKIAEENKDISHMAKFIEEAHSSGTMYEANKDHWIIKDRSKLSELIGVLCESVDELKPPLKEDIVNLLTDLADEHLAKKSSIGDKDVLEFGLPIRLKYGLILRETANGYNVYDENISTNNTIATLNSCGQITSGSFDAVIKINNISLTDILKEINDKISTRESEIRNPISQILDVFEKRGAR